MIRSLRRFQTLAKVIGESKIVTSSAAQNQLQEYKYLNIHCDDILSSIVSLGKFGYFLIISGRQSKSSESINIFIKYFAIPKSLGTMSPLILSIFFRRPSLRLQARMMSLKL